MKSFTKIANYLLRIAIVAALVTTVIALSFGGSIFAEALSGVDEANADEFLNKISSMNITGFASKIMITNYILLAAAVLSVVAFGCAKAVSSVFRTIFILITAGFSYISATVISAAEIVSREIAGTATAEEAEAVKAVVETLQNAEQSEGELVGLLAFIGCIFLVIVLGLLVVLTITSIVSVIKTAKAETL